MSRSWHNITEPFTEYISISIAPYYLRLLRSTSIAHTNTTVVSNHSSTHWSNRESARFVSIGGDNFGFTGINKNDFGLQIGVGGHHKRWSFWLSQNYGFQDWGDNQRFGDYLESLSFSNFQISYLIKK